MRRSGQACWWLCTFFLLVAFPAWGETNAGESPDERPQVSVSVYDDARVPAAVLAQAEREAGKIFARAGLEVTWVNCSTWEVRVETQASCERFAWPAYLALHIVPRSIRPMNEVFGVAFLSGEGIGCYSDVYYDQALALHADWNVGLADILGNVVAHEVGHLLLGSNSHAPAGIMRARWQGEELRRLASGSLLFTPEQAERMRRKLKAAHSSGAAPLVMAAQSTY
jgi:hypothetical protein